MTLLNDNDQRQVADAIARVERRTDAELVTVLAARADDYRYIALLWAGVGALVLPGLIDYWPQWLDAHQLLLAQWLTFIVLALLLRLPALSPRLVPRRVRHWRAANLARRQFLERRLHHTEGATGVLIFVSEAERYVEILVDRGVSSRISDDAWARIVGDFTVAVRRGETLRGFLACIEACGVLLESHLPATRDCNELPDRLVILDREAP